MVEGGIGDHHELVAIADATMVLPPRHLVGVGVQVFPGDVVVDDVGNSIKIKYGLRNNPSLAQQREWANIVALLVKQGYSHDQAGQMAAKQLFADFGSMVYRSEGDTIEMLLRQINEK